MNLQASDHISEVTSKPMVIIKGVDTNVVLSATVLDNGNKPVSGTNVTWVNIYTQETAVSKTGADGVATLPVDVATFEPAIYLFPYVAYLDSDITTGKEINIRIATPGIEMPSVTDGNDYTLDEYDIRAGVTVTIPAYEGASAGDTVTFFWNNSKLSHAVTHPLTDLPWAINAKRELPPECLANGEYTLFYQYQHSQGTYGVSIPREEKVTGGTPTPQLPAPDFPEADLNGGWINSQMALNGTIARLSWPDMAEGDVATMTWTVYNSDGIQMLLDNGLIAPVTADDVTNGYIDKVVPADDIPEGLLKGYAQAWYTMTPASGAEVGSSPVTTVGIDTHA